MDFGTLTKEQIDSLFTPVDFGSVTKEQIDSLFNTSQTPVSVPNPVEQKTTQPAQVNRQTIPTLKPNTSSAFKTAKQAEEEKKQTISRVGYSSNELRDMERAMNAKQEADNRRVNAYKDDIAPILGHAKNNISDSAKTKVDRLQKRIDRLERNGADSRKIDALQSQIDAIYKTDNSSDEQNIERFTDPDYKLTKYERKQAKKIFNDYLDKNPKAKKLYNTKEAATSTIASLSMTPEEAEEYAKMVTLKNKSSNAAAFGLGLTKDIPGVKKLADKSTQMYEKATGADLKGTDLSSQIEQAEKQSPLATMAGNTAYQLGTYAALAPAVENIPVVGNLANTVGGFFKNPTLSNAAKNIVLGQSADVLLDTLPNVVVPDVLEGNTDNLLSDIGKNQLLNLAFNAGGEVIGNLFKSLKGADIPKLGDEIAENTSLVPYKKQLPATLRNVDPQSLEVAEIPTEQGMKYLITKPDETGLQRVNIDPGKTYDSKEEVEKILNQLKFDLKDIYEKQGIEGLKNATGKINNPDTINEDVINPLITDYNNSSAELPFNTIEENAQKQVLPQLETQASVESQSIPTPEVTGQPRPQDIPQVGNPTMSTAEAVEEARKQLRQAEINNIPIERRQELKQTYLDHDYSQLTPDIAGNSIEWWRDSVQKGGDYLRTGKELEGAEKDFFDDLFNERAKYYEDVDKIVSSLKRNGYSDDFINPYKRVVGKAHGEHAQSLKQNIDYLNLDNDAKKELKSYAPMLDELLERAKNATTPEEIKNIYHDAALLYGKVENGLAGSSFITRDEQLREELKLFDDTLRGKRIKLPKEVRADLAGYGRTMDDFNRLIYFGTGDRNTRGVFREGDGIGIDVIFDELDQAMGGRLRGEAERIGNPDLQSVQLQTILDYAQSIKSKPRDIEMPYEGGALDSWRDAINNELSQANRRIFTDTPITDTPVNIYPYQEVPSEDIPQVNTPTPEAEPIKQDIPQLSEREEYMNELFNKRYDDEAINGGNNKSKLGTNTLTKMDPVQAAIDDSKGLYNYVPKGEQETMQAAADIISKDADEAYVNLLDKSDDAFTSTDVDTSMMLRNRIKSELAQAREAGDEETVNYLSSKLDALTRRQRKAATNAGQVSQAWAKWSRDADGAMFAAEAIRGKKAADVAKNNPKYAENVKGAVSDVKDALEKLASDPNANKNIGMDLSFFGKADEENEAWKIMEQHLLEENIDDMTEEEVSQDIEKAIRKILDKQENAKIKKNLQNANIKKYSDTLARQLKQGESVDETLEMLETAGITGFTEIDDSVREEVEALFEEAEKYGFDSAERMKLENQAYAKIAYALNLKGSWHDKIDSIRYFAMLANPKTHIRNMAGNWTFRQMTNFKDNLAGGMEDIFDKWIKENGGERTNTIISKYGKDKELWEASQKNVDEVKRLLSGDKYTSAQKGIEGQKAIWGYSKNPKVNAKTGEVNYKSGFDRGLDINKNALELEDAEAKYWKYADSLTRYLKANGADASIFKATDEESKQLLKRAQDHAIEQAKKATFQQDNVLAENISKFVRDARDIKLSDLDDKKAGQIGKKIVGFIADATLPFKKTPLNILTSVYEYSPANLVSIGRDIVKVSRGVDGAATKLFDDIAKTATGTGMLAMGIGLAKSGVITPSFDKERGSQDKLEGKQEYSLKIGDKSYTLNWASPALTMLLTGANIADNLGDMSLNDIASVLASAGDPVLEETMLSSLADAVSSAKYAEDTGEVFANFAGNAAKSYATQFIPSELGNISRSVDNTRRSTYSEYTGLKGTADRAIKSIENKIPVLSKNNQPLLNAWGEEQQNVPISNVAGRLAYNHLSPGFYSKENISDADRYLERLYDQTQDAALFPKNATNTINGRRLTPEEYTARQQAQGQTAKRIIEAISKDKEITSLSPDAQAKIIEKAYTEAKDAGKAAVTGEEYSLDIPSLLDSAKYDTVMKDKGLVGKSGGAYTSKSAQQAYADGQLDEYKDYRDNYLPQTGKKDSVDTWNAYLESGGKIPQLETGKQETTQQTEGIDWSQYGLQSGNGHKNLSTSYSQALQQMTSLSPEAFAKQWKAIDADSSGTMKKQEIIDYLNSVHANQDTGLKVFNAYKGSSTWNAPVLKNGKWVNK